MANLVKHKELKQELLDYYTVPEVVSKPVKRFCNKLMRKSPQNYKDGVACKANDRAYLFDKDQIRGEVKQDFIISTLLIVRVGKSYNRVYAS